MLLTHYRQQCGRFIRTVKHLQPRQIYKRIQYKFSRPRPDCRPPPPLRPYAGTWISPIAKRSCYTPPSTMNLLNETHDISDPSVWNDPELSLLWRYHLHYFDGVQDPALIQRWIQENPPGKGCGWDPYPSSLRIVNWIKWLLAGNQATPDILYSLSVQICYLRKRLEYHLLGNHLLANAKALIFAGCWFQGREAVHWLNLGLRIYRRQLSKQILKDGGHFERSPMYHCQILEDLLDVVNLLKTYQCPIPKYLFQRINKMFHWLQAMIHPDGEIAFFNDAALQQAPNFADLLAYAKRLQIPLQLSQPQKLTNLAASGFQRLALGDKVLLLDTGSVGPDYLPGHAHAGTLSFELSVAGQRVLVNSGTSSYQLGSLRRYQRSTPAHNTLSIDGKNSSEVWHRFRVGRRARVFDLKVAQSQDNMITVVASHDGYRHLDHITHRRSWCLQANRIDIVDEIIGKGVHELRLWFHLHPRIEVTQFERNQLVIALNDTNDRQIVITLPEDVDITLQSSEYYPQFGLAVPNQTIMGVKTSQLPCTMVTKILTPSNA